jgi:hypothetical protein
MDSEFPSVGGFCKIQALSGSESLLELGLSNAVYRPFSMQIKKKEEGIAKMMR